MIGLRVSLDFSSLNDEGVDNHEVSPHAIRLDYLWIAKSV